MEPGGTAGAKVQFRTAEAEDNNLEIRIYHIKKNGAELLAEPMQAETEGETAEVTAYGFSCPSGPEL